jgi:multidrug efflux pump subunit AcrA (membrane-fusion protein)
VEEFMGTPSIGIGLAQGVGQNAEATRLVLQEAQAAQQQAQAAQLQAQAAQQQAAQEAAQAAREAAQAGREAALEGARAAQQAQREAQRAMRDAQREMARARAEGRPGVVFPPFPGQGPQIPEGAVIISVAFFVMCAVIAIGFPIVRAIARRMDKRGAVAPGADSDARARLERIEQAVDAIAIEVERISEGQRFTTKLLGELRALPQPDASLAGDRGERVAVPLVRTRDVR